jgi:hypothetical protein
MLALAHKIEDAVQRGIAHDRADVARPLGLTRARVTQLLDLTLLAQEIHEAALALEAVDGVESACQTSVRAKVPAGRWARQREARCT